MIATTGRPRRRGHTLIEVAAAAFLLTVLMALTVQSLVAVAAGRRAIDRRRLAAFEAANVMERLASRPRDGSTPEAARAPALSGPARRALPGVELAVAVAERDGMTRLSVSIRWRDRSGEFEAPVRLTSWVGRRGRGGP